VHSEMERTGDDSQPVHLTYRKYGQRPAWETALPKELRVLADEDQRLYRRGLTSLGQGFGLGAIAYFRRVVENNTNRLCDLAAEAARAEGDEQKAEAIERARDGKIAEDKLKVIADLLPAVLRAGGRNPLKELYDGYSVALHGRSDSQCAAEALRLCTVFEYTFGSLHEQLQRIRAFKATAPPAS